MCCRLIVLRSITDPNDEDPLFQEGSCDDEEVHGVLCEASLLCCGCVMQTAFSKEEMASDKLITSHVFFRKNSPGPIFPPQLGLTKGHIVSVRDLFELTGRSGSILHKDKDHNDIFYSWFDVLSGPLFVFCWGSLIYCEMAVNPSSVCPKKQVVPPGRTFPLPCRPSYSCVLSILSQITVVNDTFKREIIRNSTWKK